MAPPAVRQPLSVQCVEGGDPQGPGQRLSGPGRNDGGSGPRGPCLLTAGGTPVPAHPLGWARESRGRCLLWPSGGVLGGVRAGRSVCCTGAGQPASWTGSVGRGLLRRPSSGPSAVSPGVSWHSIGLLLWGPLARWGPSLGQPDTVPLSPVRGREGEAAPAPWLPSLTDGPSLCLPLGSPGGGLHYAGGGPPHGRVFRALTHLPYTLLSGTLTHRPHPHSHPHSQAPPTPDQQVQWLS